MNPESRPMSLIRPMPLIEPLASMWADSITGEVAVTAVSKPKLRPTKLRSLSIVLGMPTMLMASRRFRHSMARSRAARSEPSPPMQKRRLMFMRVRVSTISPVSCWPREEPRIVPPSVWIVSTTSVSSIRGVRLWRAARPR